MIYTLTTPIEVGDLTKRITISRLELVSISINSEDSYVSNGQAVLSVLLRDPDSGYPLNVVYQNYEALAFWRAQTQLQTDIFAKLIADNKLPAGELSQ